VRLVLVALAVLWTAGGADASFPGSNGAIAISLERNATVDVYTISSTGGPLRRLTHSVPLGYYPAVSPDGQTIAFVHQDLHGVDLDLWLMRRDGSGGHPITRTPGGDELNPSFSPDGTHLAWSTAAGIVVASADGTGQTTLPVRSFSRGFTWTPDGRISTVSRCRVLAHPIDGGTPTVVAPLPRCTGAGSVAWSPDGRFIAWATSRGPNSTFLWAARSDGSRLHRILSVRDRFVGVAGWLRDDEVVYANGAPDVSGVREPPGQGLWAVRPDGTRRRQLVARHDPQQALLALGSSTIAFSQAGSIWLAPLGGRAHPIGDAHVSYDPAWSPDGRRLAYVRSYFGGGGPIVVARADGSRATRVTDGDSRAPSWSPDGRSLVFSRRSIFRLRLGGKPQRLPLRGARPELSPDGRRLLYVVGDTGTTKPAVADADGRNARFLIPRERLPAYRASTPTWSPDGTQVALIVDGNLEIVDASGEDLHLVTRNAAWPAWSPDGREIAFIRANKLLTVDLATKEERTVADVTGYASPPDWQQIPRS
jgi:Tol biopolymer transport system component